MEDLQELMEIYQELMEEALEDMDSLEELENPGGNLLEIITQLLLCRLLFPGFSGLFGCFGPLCLCHDGTGNRIK